MFTGGASGSTPVERRGEKQAWQTDAAHGGFGNPMGALLCSLLLYFIVSKIPLPFFFSYINISEIRIHVTIDDILGLIKCSYNKYTIKLLLYLVSKCFQVLYPKKLVEELCMKGLGLFEVSQN